MEYVFGILLLFFIWIANPKLSKSIKGFLGLIYLYLGLYLGFNHLIIGAGGVIGGLIVVIMSSYYKSKYKHILMYMPDEKKVMDISILNAEWFILAFGVSYCLKYTETISFEEIKYWHFGLIGILYLIISYGGDRKNNLTEKVIKYSILEKYADDPKWAIYIYLENGNEGWNQTIPNSWAAKDAKNGDLTFVFRTREDALRHSQNVFKNAKEHIPN